jgi:hypothetical protein
MVAACLALPTACGFDQGPNIDVLIERPELRPTAASPTVCCCRVVGTVSNRSTVPVHVEVAFDAYAKGEPKPVARALDFVEGLQPNESRNFSAVGFVQSCSSISEFKAVQPLNVRAVWLPK